MVCRKIKYLVLISPCKSRQQPLGEAEHAAAEVGPRLVIPVFAAETDAIHEPHASQTNRRNMGRQRCRLLIPRLL
jgi:hypothetical protein